MPATIPKPLGLHIALTCQQACDRTIRCSTRLEKGLEDDNVRGPDVCVVGRRGRDVGSRLGRKGTIDVGRKSSGEVVDGIRVKDVGLISVGRSVLTTAPAGQREVKESIV